MLSKEEIEKAKGWLSALDIKSEYEAISKEIILQYIEQLEAKNTDLQKSVEQIYSDYQDAGKKMFEYADKVEQLESREQKLIEKLEKEIRNANDNIKHMDEKNILQTIARELAIGMRDYAQEILKILKGEKE